MSTDHGERFATSWGVVLAAACLLAFAYACWDVQDYDVWWHLNAGRWIVEHHEIPRVEPFTHTLAGIPWVDYEWAAQPFLYGIDRVAGTPGLVVFTGLLAAAAAAALMLAMRLSGVGPGAAGLATLAVLFIAQPRIIPRPEIFSLLLLAVVQLVLSRWRGGATRAVWWLPALFLVWGNVHPGVLGGLVIVCGQLAGELAGRSPWLARKGSVDAPPILPFVYATALCGLTLLANPYGIYAPLESYHLLSSEFPKYVTEWIPTLHPSNVYKPWVVAWIGWIVFLGLSAPLLWKRRRFGDLVVALLLIPMALKSVRLIAVYAIATGVAGAVAATGWAELLRLGRAVNRRVAVGAVSLLLLVNTALLLTGAQYAWQGDGRNVGLGIHESMYPLRTMEFLKQSGIRGTMYNEYRWGGWLGWTLREPVFQDGRNLDFEQFMAARAIRDAEPGFREHLERYGVDYFIVNQPRSGRQRPVLQYLRDAPGWVLVFWDDTALVFVKRTARFLDAIRRYGYTCVDPLDPRVSRDEILESLDCVTEELERAKRFSPESASIRLLGGQLYERAGLRDRALAEYREGQQLQPGLPFWAPRIRALGG